jgi:hypothetical protein
MSVIEKKFKDHIQFLNPEEKDPGKILYNLLVNEYKRRIAHYQNIDRIFRKKYAMSYSEFIQKNIVKKENFSWNVESDAMDWEQAIDGIETMKQKLQELEAVEY